MGVVYILLIFIGVGDGVVGRVGVHTFIGEGDHCVASHIRWDFKLVRMAWCACADLVQASQFRGSSWCIHGSRSSSDNLVLNFSNTAGLSLW